MFLKLVLSCFSFYFYFLHKQDPCAFHFSPTDRPVLQTPLVPRLAFTGLEGHSFNGCQGHFFPPFFLQRSIQTLQDAIHQDWQQAVLTQLTSENFTKRRNEMIQVYLGSSRGIIGKGLADFYHLRRANKASVGLLPQSSDGVHKRRNQQCYCSCPRHLMPPRERGQAGTQTGGHLSLPEVQVCLKHSAHSRRLREAAPVRTKPMPWPTPRPLSQGLSKMAGIPGVPAPGTVRPLCSFS